MSSIKIGTDCSGIEAPIMALELMNIKYEHLFSSDIDKNCREVIKMNYNPKIIYENITKRDHSKLPKLDLYVAGFPCQAFTNLNKNAKGFQDQRGTIFFDCLQTIKFTQPKVFIFENVKGLLSHDKKNTFKIIIESLYNLLNYNIYYKVLNTKDYNLPQNRPRIYIIGILKNIKDSELFEFPDKLPLTITISDIMDKDLNVETNLTENMIQVIDNRLNRKKADRNDHYIINVGVSVNGFGSAMKEICPCLTASCTKYYSTKYNRFLIAKEYLKLQGFPSTFKTLNNENITKKQAGNSMSINILIILYKNLLKYLI
jgi:DNA (cytosine-5)-methyltransferase 1